MAAIFGMVMSGWPLLAQAHIHMEHSTPAKDAVLTVAPQTVQLSFNGKISAEWAKIEVTDAQGRRVDDGKVINSDDPKQIQIGLPGIAAGIYEVKWSAVSGDGHRVKGTFTFTVK
ncbi:MAG: copper resistance protein CopC [Gammaproteobacteria bacterium]|nr:copper resistance protein CopC [Gammaproteobacteria bacterium]